MADSGADDAALARDLQEYGAVRETYDALSGDVAEELAEKTLAELGLAATLEQPLATLSGGERNVLALAVALMRQPNLIILDEPGNHLDFAGLDWLEKFLQGFRGAVLIVSHNRYLLDRVVDTIWHLDGGGVTSYAGGYSDFRFERLTRALSEQADYKAKSQHIARLTELVRQFEIRARATGDPKWGKRLKARRTQLEKARSDLGEEPELEGRRIELSFGNVESRCDIALEVNGYDRSVGERRLFAAAEMLVTNGERVGLVGPNGSGKTTFLRDLVTTGAWENATIRVGPSMRVGYCAQHRDEAVGGGGARREGATPGGTLLDLALSRGAGTRREAYKTLGRLLFAWSDLDRSVDTLSGGEWNRLQLGLAIIRKANLLVLDEPTNHLDIESREAVEEALRDFAGTILVVSHDRYFLDAVVTRVVELTERRLESHAGSFSEFWRDRRRALHRAASTAGGAAGGSMVSRTASISARGRSVKSVSRPERAGGGANAHGAGRTPGDANGRIEEAILSLEAERGRLEGQINDAFQSGDYRLGRKLSEDLNRVNGRIEEMYQKWGA
jgi:ATP-binding cassette subfamily F protein 3